MRTCSKNPNDPAWLQARARAELLDGNYESAIKSLQRALEVQPDSPGLLTDLGSAYFVRAESTDRPLTTATPLNRLAKRWPSHPTIPSRCLIALSPANACFSTPRPRTTGNITCALIRKANGPTTSAED